MRVYLAKSNRANPGVVSFIRDNLKEVDKNKIRIVEYEGGAYNPSMLAQSNILVSILEPFTMVIGKGLYEQFKLAKTNNISIIILTQPSDGKYEVFRSFKLAILDEKNFVSYAQVTKSSMFQEKSLADIIPFIRDFIREYQNKGTTGSMMEVTKENPYTEINKKVTTTITVPDGMNYGLNILDLRLLLIKK